MVIGLILGLAQAAAAPAIAPVTPTMKSKDRVICVKEEVMGSRLQTKRVCLTPAEYEAYRLELRQKLNERQRTGYSQSG